MRHPNASQAVALAAEQAHVRLLNVNVDDWRFAIDTAKNHNWQNRLEIENQEAATGK